MNCLTARKISECGKILSKLNVSNLSTRAAMVSGLQSTRTQIFVQTQGNLSNSRFVCLRCQKSPQTSQIVSRRCYSPIVDEGTGTHKPTPFQQKVLVWEKFYPALDKIPERVSKGQMKKALDKFRVRVSILMIAITLVAAAITVAIGRSEREQGKSVTKINLSKYDKS